MNDRLFRCLRGGLALAFSVAMTNIAITYFDFEKTLWLSGTTPIVMAGLALTAFAIFGPIRQNTRRLKFLTVMVCFATLLIVPFIFVNDAFGTKDMGSIMITVQENEAGRALAVGLDGFGKDIGWHLSIILIVCSAVYVLSRTLPMFRFAAWAMVGLFLVSNPVSVAAMRMIVPNGAHALIAPEVDVHPPVITGRPTEQKNLIFVYMESIERTYRDMPVTAASFQPLAKIEDRGLSFTGLGQIAGTHFTAGGLVASQCGVPLLPKGVFNVRKKLREGVDLDLGFENFLGGIECLGDILVDDGYNASYMNGSELSIFAKGDLFKTHKYQRMFGRDSLANPAAEPRQNIWGMDDDYIFEKAKAEIAYLAAQDKPFLFSMLTIATHGPDAFVDAKCSYPAVGGSMIPAAIQCTGDHVQALIDEVDRLGLADDTVIIVLSDHLAMKNTLDPSFDAHTGDRRNYFTVLGAGHQGQISKLGTTMDIYPTVLELLGYELVGRRANMGMSLISTNPTMAQRLSLKQLSKAVDGNSTLQKRLWLDEEANPPLAGVNRPDRTTATGCCG
ncbi:MAG: sulfatase-like hydrolase/transferase [Tabrizicola sp.]|nr:sulfatase-like hydrolase/transferase [Tabrizicola sp.]